MTKWGRWGLLALVLQSSACTEAPRITRPRSTVASALTPKAQFDQIASLVNPKRFDSVKASFARMGQVLGAQQELPLLTELNRRNQGLFQSSIARVGLGAPAAEVAPEEEDFGPPTGPKPGPKPLARVLLQSGSTDVDPVTGELVGYQGGGYRLRCQTIGLGQNKRTFKVDLLESPQGLTGTLELEQEATRWVPTDRPAPNYRLLGDESPDPAAMVGGKLLVKLQDQSSPPLKLVGELVASDWATVAGKSDPKTITATASVDGFQLNLKAQNSPTTMTVAGALRLPPFQNKVDVFPFEAQLPQAGEGDLFVALGHEASNAKLALTMQKPAPLPIDSGEALPEEEATSEAGLVEEAPFSRPEALPPSAPFTLAMFRLSDNKKLADLNLRFSTDPKVPPKLEVKHLDGRQEVWSLEAIFQQAQGLASSFLPSPASASSVP